ncbi:MAG: GNAT family N-acetyltransferase [Chitinivibrionales bacterium]|nr:GNAT family N-acetyltransferase [Chitinivibrionales bacterium]
MISLKLFLDLVDEYIMSNLSKNAVSTPQIVLGYSVHPYLSEEYRSALKFAGQIRSLPLSGSFLIEKSIPQSSFMDARGGYPLMCCQDWSLLRADFRELEKDLVSVVAVTDPLAGLSSRELSAIWNAGVMPYKVHFIADLTVNPLRLLPSSHLRYVKKSQKSVNIKKITRTDYLNDAWVGLYQNLVARHSISGIAAFSEYSLRKQLEMPGVSVFCAYIDEKVVGISLWVENGNRVYYHLAAYSDSGYQNRASYALFAEVIDHYTKERFSVIDFGAGAGTFASENDGLSRFKKGWSTNTAQAYLCKHINNPEEYNRLSHGLKTDFFPAYRDARQ